jgi:hypothetical protein
MTTRAKAAWTAIVVGAALALSSPQGCDLPVIVNDPLIDGDGLHVLIMEETDDRNLMTAGQLAVITSTQVRRAVDTAGGEMLVLDVSSDLSKLAPKWAKAAQRSRSELPWWVVSSEKGGVEQPLPSSVSEAIETIEQYAPDRE